MSYDVSFLWIWLVLALLVGAVIGWREYAPGPQGPWFEGWPRRAAIVWVVAFVAAVLHVFAGRMAFWVESAVLFFAAYVIGALIGGSDFAHGFAAGGATAASGSASGGAAGALGAARDAAAGALESARAAAGKAVEAARGVAGGTQGGAGDGAQAAKDVAPAAAPAPSAAADVHADQEEAHIASVLATLPKDATPQQKADAVGQRPQGLDKPRGDAPDDLQRIKGVGPVNERNLNALGVHHFDQIAAWTRPEIRWVGTYLSFPGRIDREHWVAQADNLAKGGKGLKDEPPKGHPHA